MTAKAMSEEQMVYTVRNVLLVAGQEMGNGDQWPVVKDTVYRIMKDWENLKTERNVDEELKLHLYTQLKAIEASMAQCKPDVQAKMASYIKDLREVTDAYFSDLDRSAIMYDDGNQPEHISRMNSILATMESDNE